MLSFNLGLDDKALRFITIQIYEYFLVITNFYIKIIQIIFGRLRIIVHNVILGQTQYSEKSYVHHP